MKTFTLAMTIALLSGFAGWNSLAAQDSDYYTESETKHGGFGIKGGISLSTIGFDYEEAVDHKNRFRVGGFGGLGYETKSKNFFAFEIEALYDLRGTKEEIDLIGGGELIQKNYLHYIHFPASFKFYLVDNFNLNIGGFAAVLAGGKIKTSLYDNTGELMSTSSTKITGSGAQDAEGDDYLKRVDAGLHLGAEFVSDGGIGVGAKFSKGLVDISNDAHVLGKGNARTTEINIYLLFRL